MSQISWCRRLSMFFWLSASLMLFVGFCDAEDEKALAGRLQKRIDAFHEGAEQNGEELRVVYFCPKDAEPQQDYEARVGRILLDTRDFYQSWMRHYGFAAPELPLEMTGDTPVIHLVKGHGTSKDYTYESGRRVRGEIQRALGGKIDLDRDFVLVMGGMCQKRGEKHYFFHAPYYGSGNHRSGIAYAADCEILDPGNLTELKARERMRYQEHLGDFRKSVARFNSWYLGGIVHELGHGLSLPHNGQLAALRRSRGTALMGGGNRAYGEDRWGGGKGSFMTFASCLRLAAHPLFTGSERRRFMGGTHSMKDLRFESKGSQLKIQGEVTGAPGPLAVIAYCDPPGNGDYDALTWVGEVRDGGRFAVDVLEHRPGPHELRLTMVHLNGATSQIRMNYPVNRRGEPDAEVLNAGWITQSVESLYLAGDRRKAAALAKSTLTKELHLVAARKLEHLVALVNPVDPVDLTKTDANSISLSDAKWKSARVGWGKPARNQYFSGPNIKDKVFLVVGGAFYEKGLYAHAPSEYVYLLDGAWQTFEATVGLQEGVGSVGRSIFIVMADGKELLKSRRLKGTESQKVRVDISGVKELRLVVESGISGNAQCWSIWGQPVVSR